MGLAFKRAFDILVAFTAILALAPVMLVVAAAIRVFMGSPILFRQVRPGLREKPFTLLKFRTMRIATDHHGQSLPDNQRITRLGHLLRTTSIDEFPQLWNVLLGQMSLVGPRPLLMDYLGRYSAKHQRRHHMRPGITGWAQVNGRQSLMVSERLDLDVWYVDHWCFWLDVKILAKTLLKVIRAHAVHMEVPWEELDDVALSPTTEQRRAGRGSGAAPSQADIATDKQPLQSEPSAAQRADPCISNPRETIL
jgi:sugar transferase EpsL